MKKELEYLIAKTLEEYSLSQVNLTSAAARENLSSQIAKNLSDKFFFERQPCKKE